MIGICEDVWCDPMPRPVAKEPREAAAIAIFDLLGPYEKCPHGTLFYDTSEGWREKCRRAADAAIAAYRAEARRRGRPDG